MAKAVSGTFEDDKKDVDERQEAEQQQHYRAIWGRLVIAEVPYPIIAADDVVIGLYANRLLFQVASTAFTVVVFFRDIVCIVFLPQESSIQIDIACMDGGKRAYIITCQESYAAEIIYKLIRPLLPADVKDNSPGSKASLSIYTTDYPFSLLSPKMMAVTGFYEPLPRKKSVVNVPFFNGKYGLSPFCVLPNDRLLPLKKQQMKKEEVKDNLGQEKSVASSFQHEQQPQLMDGTSLCSRDSASVFATAPVESEKLPFSQFTDFQSLSNISKLSPGSRGKLLSAKKEKDSEDFLRLVSYDVVTGGKALTECEEESFAAASSPPSPLPFATAAFTVNSALDSVSPPSWEHNMKPNPPMSTTHYLNTLSLARKSLSSEQVNAAPGLFRIGSGIVVSGIRCPSVNSHASSIWTAPIPMRLPKRGLSTTSNEHVHKLWVANDQSKEL